MNQDDEVKLIERIHKLLTLGKNNPSPEESARAVEKANQLMREYNISLATIEQKAGGGTTRREELRVATGFYAWKRELWEAIAKLNFCLYWTERQYVPAVGIFIKLGRTKTLKRVHKIVGRAVNVAAARGMADYLEGTIERMVDETLRAGQGTLPPGDYVHAFRVGMADELIQRILGRYHKRIGEERLKEEKAERAARRAAAKGVSTSTAVTISSFTQSEEAANMDFVYGDGFSAEQAAREAAHAKTVAENEAAFTRWAKANPEKAEKMAREEDARWRRSRYRGGPKTAKDKLDHGAYNRGRAQAEKVSLDQQVDSGKVKRLK